MLRKFAASRARRPGPPLGAAALYLLAGSTGWAGEPQGPASRPLDLLLTRAELAAIVRNYEARTGQDFSSPIGDEDILVTAPGLQAPMRDVSRDVGLGIFAPFWAVANPREAWRIFVPIPPKGRERRDERPAPDPR